MRVRRQARRRQGAQAALEMALILPLMLTITLGFVGVMIEMRAESEFQTAVDLAAQASIVPPLGDSAESLADAQYAFVHTLNPAGTESSFLTVATPLSCSGPYLRGEVPLNDQGLPAPAPVTCSASAELDFSQSPVGILWFWSVNLSATSEVQPSVYRGCQSVAASSVCQPPSS